MIAVALLGQAAGPVLAWLGFSSEQVLAGQVWRIASYGLFNPPSLFFAVDMLMLWWFGGELERTFGRRIYGWLYAGIYLLPPLVLLGLGLFRPTVAVGQPGALALFIAFATHFPGAPVFFTLLAKWAALILVGIYSLIHLAGRDWDGLVFLWTTCGYAHLFVRHQQGVLPLPSLPSFKRKPKLRVLPDLPAKKNAPAPATAPAAAAASDDSPMAEIDALLDKIAKSGIGSLSAREREKLEAARADLLRRQAAQRR
jgi:hypothetical protein